MAIQGQQSCCQAQNSTVFQRVVSQRASVHVLSPAPKATCQNHRCEPKALQNTRDQYIWKQYPAHSQPTPIHVDPFYSMQMEPPLHLEWCKDFCTAVVTYCGVHAPLLTGAWTTGCQIEGPAKMRSVPSSFRFLLTKGSTKSLDETRVKMQVPCGKTTMMVVWHPHHDEVRRDNHSHLCRFID